jgi:hypothetical protein
LNVLPFDATDLPLLHGLDYPHGMDKQQRPRGIHLMNAKPDPNDIDVEHHIQLGLTQALCDAVSAGAEAALVQGYPRSAGVL